MLITAITHASARDKDFNFRGLTAEGARQSSGAAAHYRKAAGPEPIPVTHIVASPKPRCLETVITFAKALRNEEMYASAVEVDPGLAAGEIEGDELARMGREARTGHVLVAGHADLSRTLPDTVSLSAEAASDGWFQMRPVLFQIEIEPDEAWSEARIRFCDALVDGEWKSLLQRDSPVVPEA